MKTQENTGLNKVFVVNNRCFSMLYHLRLVQKIEPILKSRFLVVFTLLLTNCNTDLENTLLTELKLKHTIELNFETDEVCEEDCKVEEELIDLGYVVNLLKYTETDLNLDAVGDKGKAFGVLQIHDICVRDVNRLYKTDYTHKQMFKEKLATEVTLLYLRAGIKRFKRLYKKNPTEEQVVRMHNGGIYKGYKIAETLRYYKRYLRYKKKLNKNII